MAIDYSGNTSGDMVTPKISVPANAVGNGVDYPAGATMGPVATVMTSKMLGNTTGRVTATETGAIGNH